MSDENWVWDEGVLYENGEAIARATASCDVLRAKKIYAAPDMERALIMMLASLRENGGRSSMERAAQCGHAGECRFQRASRAIDAAEAALTKAGVPVT